MLRQYHAPRRQGGDNPLGVGTVVLGAVFYLQDDGHWRARFRGGAICRAPWIVEAFLNGQYHAARRDPDTGHWLSVYVATHALLTQTQQVLNNAMNRVYDNITNIGNLIGDRVTSMGGLLDTKLGDGFTQISNYQRAQISAVEQIADASNTANARVMRNHRNAEIRDEHVPSPQACLALDSGQATSVSQIQGDRIAAAINTVMDARGEGAQGTAAWYGQAQSMTSSNALHLARYCTADEAAASLCTMSVRPNADVRAATFNQEVYTDVDAVNAANDYATNVVQPVVPAALRGDHLSSVEGQNASALRRAYDARMSLARSVFTTQIAMNAPAVTLNDAQRALITARGGTPPDASSWMQVLSLEVDRRFSDTGWASSLQAMPPAAVSREIAAQLALSNYLALQNLRVGQQIAAVGAANLAVATERGFPGIVPVPSPSFATN